jgi:Tol biopolymer transport system component
MYFNSDRSGTTQVWRVRPDGSGREQLTKDGENWYPHVSPDGRLLAFLTPGPRPSHFPDDVVPVALRVMSLADGHVRVLAKFTGSGESMPLPSWSPDSRRLAFVSYQFEPPAPAVVK